MDWSYTTDPVGNPLAISSSLVPAQSRDYEYEPYSYFLERDQGYWLNTFVYDKIGNRMSEVRGSVGSLFTYHQNPSGGNSPRLASVTNGSSTLTYGYDAAGNTTSIVGTNPPSTSTYILNYRGELSSIKSSGGGANNSYDGRGFLYRSVGKSTPRFNTDFIYGSDGLLWEYATEDVAAHETHVHRIVRFAGRPVAVVRWGEPLEAVQRRYYTTDHLGTPILVTDEAGDEVWSGGFGAFGEDTYFGAFGSDIRLGLPGQFEDPSWAPATTLRYNVHRWYEPSLGLYSAVDPILSTAPIAGQIRAAFRYARANPMVWRDYLGLQESSDCCDCPSQSWGYSGASLNFGVLFWGHSEFKGTFTCSDNGLKVPVKGECSLRGLMAMGGVQWDFAVPIGGIHGSKACKIDELLGPAEGLSGNPPDAGPKGWKPRFALGLGATSTGNGTGTINLGITAGGGVYRQECQVQRDSYPIDPATAPRWWE